MADAARLRPVCLRPRAAPACVPVPTPPSAPGDADHASALLPAAPALAGAAAPPSVPVVVLDGANIMWAYGIALARRFGCKVYPSAAGLLLALDYEVRPHRSGACMCVTRAPALTDGMAPQPWRDAGVRVVALLPDSYAAGELDGLADGCGGDASALAPGGPAQRAPGGGNSWRNAALCAAAAAGRVQLVRRAPGERGRGDDDRELIRVARERGAYVCSNDLFRDHFKLRGASGETRPAAAAGGAKRAGEAQLFRNRKRFGEWGRERRFGCRFAVAPGLDDATLLAMARASGHAAEGEADGGAEALRALRAAPWRHPCVPVYFQPQPGAAMLTARAALRARAARERLEAAAAAA